MVQTAGISTEVERRIQELGAADIVIGVPSFNNAETIGHVVSTIQRGLQQYFPSARCAIVNSDGGSRDGTSQRVLDALPDSTTLVQVSHEVPPVQRLSTPYSGVPGKGNALKLVFELSRSLAAKACAIVDSDQRGITPEWVRLLVQPVLEQGYDFAAPQYLRHKFDGTITTSIVYPLTRALYGKRIRQPIGGEFCLSRGLIESCLAQNVWNTDVAWFGIDLWVATHALCGGFRACQVLLGAKTDHSIDPGADLSTMLAQVLGTTFAEMERNAIVWQKVRGSEPIATLGVAPPVDTEPVNVDATHMIDSFRIGYENLYEVWSVVLPPATLLELKKLARCQNGEFAFSDHVWVRVIYDFAVAHHLRTIARDHLLRTLTPLYLGRVASFVLQMRAAEADEIEDRIEDLCVLYEKDKPYLISRWRWPDRFSP